MRTGDRSMRSAGWLLSSQTNSFSLIHGKYNTPCFPPNRKSPRLPELIIRTTISDGDTEIRVCTNRTCRRQGSMQILDTLSGIAPPNIVVKPCGCLGKCGSGPNLVALPGSVFVSYCGTPSLAANFMADVCGVAEDDAATKSLQALALRKKSEIELENGNLPVAESLVSQAIDLKPFGGLHFTYRGRSMVKLKMGDFEGALADAEEALILAPNYAEAYICQGDAFLGMDQFHAAEKSYLTALDKDPSIRRSKSFKVRISNLEEKLASISAGYPCL